MNDPVIFFLFCLADLWFLISVANSSLVYFRELYSIEEEVLMRFLAMSKFPFGVINFIYENAAARSVWTPQHKNLKLLMIGRFVWIITAGFFVFIKTTLVVRDTSGWLLIFFFVYQPVICIEFIIAWRFGSNLKDYKMANSKNK